MLVLELEGSSDEAGVEELGFVVEERLAVFPGEVAACAEEDGVAGGGVPFPGWAGAEIELGVAGGDHADLETGAAGEAVGDGEL